MKTTALSSLLLVGAAATLAAATPAQRPSNRMSPYDVPTANYVPLKPVTPSEPEHARIARMRAARRRWSRREPASGELAVSPHGYHDNGSPRVLKPRHLQQLGPMERPGTGPGENPRMMTNYKDIYYIIEILAGTQAISVSVDTGSSDTWFIQSGVQCVDYLYRPQPEVKCGFAKGFEGKFSGGMIPNDRFTRAYADGTFVVGTYGFEDVTVGGITVTRQQLALVNMTFWFGEGLTSGLMGLAYPLLTGLDGSGNDRPAYDPIFTSMWKRGLITAPLFSIALSRNDPPTAAGAANGTDVASLDANKGSYIAFGGIPPDIKYDDASWARAPVLGMEEIANIESSEPGMYIIKADAYVWGKGHDPKLTTSAGPPPDHLTVNTTQFPVIVDVGASVTILPTFIAKAVFSSFSPPALYERSTGSWFARCDATLPTLGIKIGSQTFYFAAQDLLRQGDTARSDSSMCRIGIVDDDYGPWVLGVTFLTNVLTVFDIGNREVRFASRIAY